MNGILKSWLPLVVITTAFAALAYVSVQQAYRQSADDPQIQMAEDTAAALEAGRPVDEVLPAETIDIAHSLAPFYVVFAETGEPVAATGSLNGEMPRLPDGVLAYARENGQHRLTWQPAGDTRIATVIVPSRDGFVLAGRNLREVEAREEQVSRFAVLAWLLSTIGTFVVIGLCQVIFKEA
ncbi:MAG TPA: hypothetical protein VGJ22_10350 [Anaerolineales bacterium]|jgi:hypothetical protein